MVHFAGSHASLAMKFQKKGWRTKVVNWRRKPEPSIARIHTDLKTNEGKRTLMQLVYVNEVLLVVISPPRSLTRAHDFVEFLCAMMSSIGPDKLLILEAPTYHELWDCLDVARTGLDSFEIAPCNFAPLPKTMIRVLTNAHFLRELEGRCNGHHSHQPRPHDQPVDYWHSELGELLVGLTRSYLHDLGRLVPMQVAAFDASHATLAASGKMVQPRRRFYQAISEHSELKWVAASDFSEGMTVLFRKRGVNGAEDQLWVGILRSPMAFHHAAAGLTFPLDSPNIVPDDLLRAMSEVLTLGPAGLAELRANRLRWLIDMKLKLKPNNADIHRNLDPLTSKVMKGKDFALMKWLLDYFQYPDTSLVDDMIAGFEPLTTCLRVL